MSRIIYGLTISAIIGLCSMLTACQHTKAQLPVVESDESECYDNVQLSTDVVDAPDNNPCCVWEYKECETPECFVKYKQCWLLYENYPIDCNGRLKLEFLIDEAEEESTDAEP